MLCVTVIQWEATQTKKDVFTYKNMKLKEERPSYKAFFIMFYLH